MPLSKSTTDQIRKEAKKKYKGYATGIRELSIENYIEAATIWAEKAAKEKEGLVKALERAVGILETECDYESVTELRATLEQYK